MSRIKDTVWDLDPHTKAKHEILRKYLEGWFPILSSIGGRIVYLDGFAGPGIYSNGEEGSPIIALRTAFEHKLMDKFHEIRFLFIESRIDRAEKLEEVIEETFPDLPDSIKYEVISGEFEKTLGKGLDELEKSGSKLAPCFAFIDPFGYTGFSMKLLEKLLSHERCEVFITFMSGFVKRFLDEGKGEALDNLFGTGEWREIKDIEEYRDQPLLALYIRQLKKNCNVKYIRSFKIIGEHNQVIYHLIFCTNHIKGLDIMKRAMWKVDRTGEYKFSDRDDPEQTYLFDFQDEEHWIPVAADKIYGKFKGLTIDVANIEEFVIAETDYIFKKGILRYIEKTKPEYISRVINRTRKGTFPDRCLITFTSV